MKNACVLSTAIAMTIASSGVAWGQEAVHGGGEGLSAVVSAASDAKTSASKRGDEPCRGRPAGRFIKTPQPIRRCSLSPIRSIRLRAVGCQLHFRQSAAADQEI